MIESHQVKHWQLEHKELNAPPRFKFSIVSTFTDPLTRQLSESVRIERRGADILNSRSEYSRCQVPRLRIDKELWLSKTKDGQVPRVTVMGVDTTTLLEARANEDEETEMQKSRDEIQEEVRNAIEDEVRRLDEKKRKGTSERVRKRKKRKFDRLEDWGEATPEESEEDSIPTG